MKKIWRIFLWLTLLRTVCLSKSRKDYYSRRDKSFCRTKDGVIPQSYHSWEKLKQHLICAQLSTWKRWWSRSFHIQIRNNSSFIADMWWLTFITNSQKCKHFVMKDRREYARWGSWAPLPWIHALYCQNFMGCLSQGTGEEECWINNSEILQIHSNKKGGYNWLCSFPLYEEVHYEDEGIF